jgi:hypothetical protein
MEQFAAAAGENVPGAQVIQLVSYIFPVSGWYLPAEHISQLIDSDFALYFPVTQKMQLS